MMHLRNMLSAKVDRLEAGALADPAAIPLAANRTAYLTVKLIVEWTAALLLLATLFPVLAALAVLVKFTSVGPAFYSQIRLGRSGRPFRIYKLRTMAHQCEAATGPVWSIADDPRVTRVGRWLRDTHLDEIPQLFNVLRGEMALVGPRPERPEIAARIEQSFPDFQIRLLVRPGITGLAQMRMPADTDLNAVQRKLAHDLHYIRHIGPAIDARIFLSTFFYFPGAAARAASRQLVQPYAPPVVTELLPIAPPVLSIKADANLDLSFAA
jgi:lipopolysaccharide/colanic/teichoic acid biosynthesis glycosyltransferase